MIYLTVQSQSKEGKEYKIVLAYDGWHCTCPDFLFREKKIKYCKHIIDAYKKLEEKLEIKS